MKWIYDHLLYVLVGGISLFTLVSHSSAFYAPSISLFVFLVSTLVLVCVPFLKLNRRDFHWPVLVVVGFWAWSLISGFFGNEFGLSMVGFFGRGTSVFFSLICMLAFLLVAQSGFLLARKVLVLLPLLGGIMGLLGVGEWLGVLQFSPDPSRLYGIPRNPIFLANMLTVTLAFTLYYYFSRKITHKAWLLVSAFLQVFTLFFTLTRGTLIGLAIALAVWFVVYMHRKLKFGIATRSWVIPVAAVLLLLVVGYAARGTTIHRLTTVSDTSAQTRLITWISSLPGFLENPVLGVGPENFYVISAKYFDPRQYQYSESGFFDKPHNQFLQVLVEQGGVGFVLYVLIVFSVYRMLFLARKRERLTSNQFWSLAACVAAYYSTLFFAFESPQALILFFLLIGFLYILAFADVNEQAKFKLSTSTIVTAVCAAVLWYFVPLHGISLARSAGLALSASPQSHISGDAAEKFLRNLR
ncbi:MAG TPA: O-antigen ligase family protein, partial [Flavobacteriales bacterium]|nr:O-antigen ligase family protein [Flavobacteriales bacterium]